MPATMVPVGRVRVAAVELAGCFESMKIVWPTEQLAKVGANACGRSEQVLEDTVRHTS